MNKEHVLAEFSTLAVLLEQRQVIIEMAKKDAEERIKAADRTLAEVYGENWPKIGGENA